MILASTAQMIKNLFNCVLKRVKETGGETMVRIRPCGYRLNKTSGREKQTADICFLL